ncbi:MAG: cytochrome ubiquinol oxidase subunit I [Sphingomicrobium sp.]
MAGITDYVLLSRLQFAVTTLFHILWPVLTIGLSLFLVVTEVCWIRTGDDDYYRHARFWSRLFLLNFSIGVVTGLPLEFEFGTNWAPFSTVAGSFFGNILGFEGAMAFMLEAGFLGIMMFGWQKVPRAVHLLATCMVAFGASLSAFWIMDANSWMQTPAGGHMQDGHFVIDSYLAAIFNPDMPWGVAHMWVACLETSLFVIGGISAWYLLRGRNVAFFLKSFRLAVALAVVITPLQIWLGDGSGQTVFAHQPAKGAALEGHWTTNAAGDAAPWALLAWPNQATQSNDWAIEIPGALSVIATRSLTGTVRGLKDFAPQDQPPLLPLIFYAFRAMVAIGFGLFFLMLWTGWTWFRGRLSAEQAPANRWLLRAWVATIPLGYIAVDLGWTVREVGRQPWVIYGLLRTSHAASVLPVQSVFYSLFGYFALYLGLLIAFVVFAWRIVQKGPNLTVQIPDGSRRQQDPLGHRSIPVEKI